MKSKVFIAGAGCGDEELITLKLKKVIEKADCIIYDRLVNKNILRFAKSGAELIYMGKENFEGGELQKEINKKIIEKATEEKVVNTKEKIILRLKGGDPFVFGRGGEEIEAILGENELIKKRFVKKSFSEDEAKKKFEENKIEFEVIPGITSSIAVPAYAGIPVTHRGINTSFHVFTGHTKIDGKEPDFSTIAKLSGTLIYLMGLSNLKKIVKGLTENGKDVNTPVTVIKDGTTAKQKTFVGTLATICEIVKKNDVKSPVIILIGEVANFREKMKWFEKKALFGKNVLVTRNKEKQGKIVEKISELGGQAILLPFIEIEYRDFEMLNLSEFEAILFNSANSVIGFMEKLQDVRKLANVKIGAVGTKTAEEIAKYRIIPDFYPSEYTVEKLAEESVKFTKENSKILFVVSNISPVNTEKYSNLYNRKFEKIVVYNTLPIIQKKEIVENSVENSDILMFLSSSTFEAFAKSINLENNKKMLDNKIVTSIGPVTTKTIEKYGIKVSVEAKEFTEEGLFREIINFFDK